MKTFLSILVFIVLLCSGCSLNFAPTPEPTTPSPTAEPVKSTDNSGFWYYEDLNLPAGRDPLFAVCNGKVIKLLQNGNGWDYQPITMDEFKTYQPLNPTGRISDNGYYTYHPETGEIWLKENTPDAVLVQKYIDEYNPQHWVWTWSSLMFIKDCRLYIFYVLWNDDKTVTYKKYPGIEFTG